MPVHSFTRSKCIEAVEKGRRKKWWRRGGSRSRGFSYTDADGKPITDQGSLDRITSLVIPPAWRFVRISPHAKGSLQVVGIDTTGRIQYIYHPSFRKKKERKKFSNIISFGERLAQLKEQTNRDLMLSGLPPQKVLAVMLRLINSLYFRVGTDASAKIYRTYGITTLKKAHLTAGRNGKLCFEFVGKSHVNQRKILVDKEIAAVMRKLTNIGPKRKLFHYLDESGKPHPVKPADINRYIKAAMGSEFSAKDLRTWGAGLICARELARLGPADSDTALKKNIVAAVKFTAQELGNTPAVCRASYIHPAILEAYAAGITLENFPSRSRRRKISGIADVQDPEEASLLKLLKHAVNGGSNPKTTTGEKKNAYVC